MATVNKTSPTQMTASIVQLKPDFFALQAEQPFKAGETVVCLRHAEIFKSPDFTTVDLGNKHVYHHLARYINHSCEPNCIVDTEQESIVASKAIAAGDSITFNYLLTERTITSPFDCLCGAAQCMGRIEKPSPV